jgi:Na+/H+ antiporter NhaD/arsenite permease-like protein
MLTFKIITGIIIFILTFIMIISEKVPPSLSAIIGGGAMIIFGIIDEHEAMLAISRNLEILLLLMGLMMIVAIMSETGMFQYLSVKLAQRAKGDPVKIMIFLGLGTALCSAFLDNVTTVLLVAPISILLAEQLKIKSFPFLMVEIFAANIGGAATLIGDPPNLIIGSMAGFKFNDFIYNLAPLVIINLGVLIFTMVFIFRKQMDVSRVSRAKIMEMEAERVIKDKGLLIKSLIVFITVIFGFLTHTITGLGLATISIMGAGTLILISKKSPEDIFNHIEWPTIFFLSGLFILVDGVENIGVIEKIGEHVVRITQGDLNLTAILTLWFSSLLSPFMGAVPYTVSFAKVITEISPNFIGDTSILWWSLSLGACLGGNMTIVGAAANVVGSGIASKSGNPISFKEFFKYGSLVVLQSAILSTLYIIWRY